MRVGQLRATGRFVTMLIAKSQNLKSETLDRQSSMPAAFPEINKIPYEGPTSKNPLAFRWYNASEKVEGKTMAEHLRFSVVYWHTFRGTGSDPCGAATILRPRDDGSDSV